ncbi:MAG: PEP-utilizing enzyme [Acidimicrobiia bacterium]|nr:PEP-utilizing enzyme [Acidimicrobiia bacterium]
MACTSTSEEDPSAVAEQVNGQVEPALLLGLDQPATAELGGKGRALAELVRLGFPVPPTGVITTVAYRAVAAGGRVAELAASIVAGDAPLSEEVDRVFADAPIDPVLEGRIVDLARAVGDGGPIAVRSSATVEDLHGSSFAGQYRSVLDVDSGDPAEVLDAVRQVWASLWHPAPSAYRRAFGIDEAGVAMAVVFMAMIPAETAGVVFTADPGGSAGSRVEAVEGLGESLVSGERTPSAWVVPRPLEPSDQASSPPSSGPPLPPAAAEALVLAVDIEEAFGAPQDVEWAAVGDAVYVVQARPITALDDSDGFDTPLDDHELTTGGIVEMVPGALPPLRWEVNRFILEEAFRSVLDSLGIIRGLAAEDHRFVRRVRGRAAIDFDQLRAAAADLPGAVEELEYQYFGEVEAAPLPDRRRRWGGRLAAIRRDLLALRTRRLVIDQAEVLVKVTAELRRRKPLLTDSDDREMLAYSRRLVDLSARGLAAELGVAAAAAGAYGRLEGLLGRYLEVAEAARAVQSVTAVAVSADRTPSSSAAVFAGPTWTERRLTPPTGTAGARRPSADQLAALERRLTSIPGWTRRRILTGQIIDVRLRVIRRAVADLVEQLHRREAAKAAVLELGGELRRVHLELGARLVERDLLDRAVDVELLSSAELAAACHGDPVVGRDVIRRRHNWMSRYEAEGALPTRFVGVPDRAPTPLPEGDELTGWGASPGRSRGRARVVRDPTDALDMGEVIVAEATDASYSPMFVRAGGIVVERGGPLSHAAILARELGLPCVMNVPGATGRLDGRLVSVDGDRGIVVIEAEEGDR